MCNGLSMYGTALGQLDACTRLHVQDYSGGDADTRNIKCGHLHTSQSQ